MKIAKKKQTFKQMNNCQQKQTFKQTIRATENVSQSVRRRKKYVKRNNRHKQSKTLNKFLNNVKKRNKLFKKPTRS